MAISSARMSKYVRDAKGRFSSTGGRKYSKQRDLRIQANNAINLQESEPGWVPIHLRGSLTKDRMGRFTTKTTT